MSLNFECKQCAECCRNIQELILLEKDIARIKNFLNSNDFYFEKNGIAYLKLKGDKGCIFLEGQKCSIYQVRPTVCKAFPLQLDVRRRVWVLNKIPCNGWNIQDYLKEQGVSLGAHSIKYSYTTSVTDAKLELNTHAKGR